MGGLLCICGSFQTSTKIVAMYNIVFVTIGLIWIISEGTAQMQVDRYKKHEKLLKIGVVGGIGVTYLAACILLLVGAYQRHYCKCKIWLITNSILFILVTIVEVYGTLNAFSFGAGPAFFINSIRLMVTLAIIGCQLRIVDAFLHEIKIEGTIENVGRQEDQVHVKLNQDEDQTIC